METKYIFYVRTNTNDFEEVLYFSDTIEIGKKDLKSDGYSEEDIIGIGKINTISGTFGGLPGSIG